jgi:7,8-dihydropterin-6-yl-methyl-4-(beta-D-ribofuranosyl)aminobenzene 5'-phosphate synthase
MGRVASTAVERRAEGARVQAEARVRPQPCQAIAYCPGWCNPTWHWLTLDRPSERPYSVLGRSPQRVRKDPNRANERCSGPAVQGNRTSRPPGTDVAARNRATVMAAERWGARLIVVSLLVISGCATTGAQVRAQPAPDARRITILYDAFGKVPGMQKDWGFAALVEYGGKRILFDTGDDPVILAQNASAKGVDLSKLDFVVMSHRHGDHMGGMAHLLQVNPDVKIYAPKENFGVYGFSLPSTFYRRDESLPTEQRYYDGNPPQTMKFGSAWPTAHFELIDKTTEIAPGIHLIALVSEKPTTLELRELSLAIDTPDGVVLVVGCSHPGIDRIAQAVVAMGKRIHMIVGGFHLVVAKDPEIDAIVTGLRDTAKVAYVAPGHCTGEPTFAALRKGFGDRYLYAGLGTTLDLTTKPAGVTAPIRSGGPAMDEEDLGAYRANLAKQLGDRDPLALGAVSLRPESIAPAAR